MKKYSFFSLQTQFENLGDALINREMILLASQNSEVYLDLSRCSVKFVHSLEIHNFDNVNIVYGGSFSLFKKMLGMSLKNKKCYYFLSPGGYFGSLTIKSFVSSWINTLVLSVFTFLNVKICHVGVSYERLSPIYVFLLRFRTNNILHAHYLRDEMSANYAKSKNIKFHKIMPDLAFNIFPDECEVDDDSIKKVCLSFRVDQKNIQKNSVLRFLEMLNDHLADDVEILLYSQVTRDSEFMKSIRRENIFEKKKISFVDVSQLTLSEATQVLQSCDLVLSNRLHVLLLGAAAGTKVLSCTSDHINKKIEGVVKDLKLKNSIKLDHLDEIVDLENVLRGNAIQEVGYVQKTMLKKKFKSLFKR